MNPDTRDVPIILCTIIEDRERAFRLGVADYLTKPIMEDDLSVTFERLGLGAPAVVTEPEDDAPAESVPQQEEPAEALPESEEPSAGQNGHQVETQPEEEPTHSVLVIDDEPDFVDFVRDGLQGSNGFAVASAVGGQAGLEAVSHDKPDAIIMDVALSDLDGFQVLAKLGESPETSDIPVLVLSSDALSPEDFSRLTEQAVSMIVKREYGEDELLDTIATALTGML